MSLIDRTKFNALVDDDGTNTYGTVWNKQQIKDVILDPADVAYGALSGQIKFPATQNPSADPNTLDDYEEGTWTPVDGSGAGLAFAGQTGRYIKIGRFVCASAGLSYPATANGANACIGGLPYAMGAQANIDSAAIGYTNYGAVISIVGLSSTSTLAAFNYSGANLANSAMSGKTIFFTLCYLAA